MFARILLAFPILIISLVSSVCFAGSLWDRRDPSKVFLFYDTQARHTGDLLTILINENTEVENKDNRSLDKETESNGAFDFTSSTSGDFGSSAANANLDSKLTSNRKFDGKSEFKSDRDFSDRVTVTVLDVLPNGNLVVGGKRHIDVEGDHRTLVVSGIVRLIDISADNTIQSRYVANLEIAFEGKGVETRFTKHGWLGRVANKIWPF